MTEATTIRNLLTDDINDFPVNEFMTLHTDQFIDANIFITKIHVSDIVCNTLNDMPHFSSNVALIGQNNVIQCKLNALHLATRKSSHRNIVLQLE